MLSRTYLGAIFFLDISAALLDFYIPFNPPGINEDVRGGICGYNVLFFSLHGKEIND
jgi:hypothetical protein